MKQRLGIAQSLRGHPRLPILDEPINGLDADGMRIVREAAHGDLRRPRLQPKFRPISGIYNQAL